ncbi:two-component system cell cycle sensor histidine kinase PleC [Rhizobium sp. SG_E_25_P2]|uniref:sensor histidine kinase n=1 Tax=Rhizobium sp. SG_E_25_P2 TaxID=2879942 RepID=UPI002474FB34|nr:HAMP domain-containing sensor histidine kinase [Rhizobium sp. SG_E_25_P2]MDH6268056.1 two-component system cell cycle sensor histidine kinase PleC [Rhizobium sp. SG_E_25_P2]
MSQKASLSPDKIIVDRSRVSRNKDVARAVKTTRERLQTNASVGNSFDKELLALHLSSIQYSAAALPLFAIVISLIANSVFTGVNLFSWMLASLAVHSLQLFVSRRAQRSGITHENVQRWRRALIAAQAPVGLCWAWFAVIDCSACTVDSYFYFKSAVLILALSATSMAQSMLRGATLYTFLPVVVALAYGGFQSRAATDLALTAVFTMSLVFFVFITNRLYSSNIQVMSFQSEKDDLIAELEVAKSMSDEARRRAEEANLAKSRFLASMSHELRTPLNAILGFSEVMATEVLGPLNNPTYKEYVADIHTSGQHLLNLINEILDLSRIEAGRYQLNEEAVQLVDITEDCIGMVQLRAKSKSIRVVEQYEPSMPSIWADEKAVRQIILNILSNAVKFTPQGGEIVVKAGWTASGGQYVSIKDNGPGIAEEEIPVVLSAFGQGSIAIKSAEQGTGLGLPIVQALLHKHDGQFYLKSKLREGTECIAILPAKRVLQTLPAVEETAAVDRKKKTFA